LIVAGGCRGRQLATALVDEGYAVRITTRREEGRAAIEAAGAECWIGTPDRLATLRGALDNVTILCWLLGSAVGSPEMLQALHTSRLEFFFTQAIDTTVRGIVYESRGASPELLVQGEAIARALTKRNEIPMAFLDSNQDDHARWLTDASDCVRSLLVCA
jgi:uncharacterized protein YbjT (DUF2867 family)